MAVTFADCQHSGNDPRQMSQQKIMLSFGAIIFVTYFRNGVRTPKGSTPSSVSRSRSRCRRTEVQKAKKLHLGWGKQDQGVTNCSRHCLLSNWEPRRGASSAGATTKPHLGPLRALIEDFTSRSSLSVSPTTCMNRWSASDYSWCAHYATPLQHHRPSGPQHEQAQIDPNVQHCLLRTRHDKQSV